MSSNNFVSNTFLPWSNPTPYRKHPGEATCILYHDFTLTQQVIPLDGSSDIHISQILDQKFGGEMKLWFLESTVWMSEYTQRSKIFHECEQTFLHSLPTPPSPAMSVYIFKSVKNITSINCFNVFLWYVSQMRIIQSTCMTGQWGGMI